MKMISKFLILLVLVGFTLGCVPVETLPTEMAVQFIETPPAATELAAIVTKTSLPTATPTPVPAARQVSVVFFPDINANGRQDTLAGNGQQARMVSYSDLVVGLSGAALDQLTVDETFDVVGFNFELEDELCLKVKDNGEEVLNECQPMEEIVTFSLEDGLRTSHEAVAFLTINGLNRLGIGYVGFSAREVIHPLNDEFSIRTTTYEQLLGEQTSIIIMKPLVEFLAADFFIGVKQGNHVLPFLPVDIVHVQVRNSFDFSPDLAIKYGEFGLAVPLENDQNGKDGLDFYPLVENPAEQSVLILAGTSGQIVFTDLPARGVIEICPALQSQKSCSSLARNRENPQAVDVLIGDTVIGRVEPVNLFMTPGDEVGPGFPIAVMGMQGSEMGDVFLQYTHRYRFHAHNALPMVELSAEVIGGINLREYPESFIESTLITRCGYSVFSVDPNREFLLGFPEDASCQIPFFSWALYGEEIFVPLPDAELVRAGE